MAEDMTEGGAREKLKLVFTGHVDHGKSTVIGRLLFDTGSLNDGAVAKVRRIAAETGQPFEFAHLLDAFEEEQKQGITIDTTQLQFRTGKRDYVIIDAPGHKEFLKNMISGASDAEAAFLVVDAGRGVEEQSRRHAHMLSLLGVRQIGLVVNKMDLVRYDREVFESVSREASEYLAGLGLEINSRIPLSGLMGENVVRPSTRMPWHRGPTLVGALDGLKKSPSPAGRSLRLPLQAVYKFDDRRILAGRVESGRVKIGDRVLISPGRKTATVTSLAAWLDKDLKDEASAGESVGVMINEEFFHRRGDVVSLEDDPPMISDRIKASVFWMGRTPLKPRGRYKLKLASAEVEAEISEIDNLIDSSTLAPAPKPARVGFNEVAQVEIRLQRPLALDLFSRHQGTGRFVLVDGHDVAGGGIVTWAEGRSDIKFGFVHGELKARCEIFEEYYYNVDEMSVSKAAPERPLYTVGDRVPLTGASYRYPELFDIVIFRDRMAVRVRDGRVAGMLPLGEYSYQGAPLVNGRGFGVLVRSQDDWLKARADFEALTPANESDLAKRWLDFNTYRRIVIGGNDFQI
ncbi:MAG: 50S ribosome-binding GTPase [Deltaproteobacteria bacterium]|jgi:sulfate adenylyltransferase large subunit|nr:50S ribosome-binding GTPase [Deltaproteobacteria bacterium]